MGNASKMDNTCLTVCNAGGPQAAACLGVIERPGLGGGHRKARSQAAGRAAAAAVPTELERHGGVALLFDMGLQIAYINDPNQLNKS